MKYFIIALFMLLVVAAGNGQAKELYQRDMLQTCESIASRFGGLYRSVKYIGILTAKQVGKTDVVECILKYDVTKVQILYNTRNNQWSWRELLPIRRVK
jgi:hypothetical protein